MSRCDLARGAHAKMMMMTANTKRGAPLGAVFARHAKGGNKRRRGRTDKSEGSDNRPYNATVRAAELAIALRNPGAADELRRGVRFARRLLRRWRQRSTTPETPEVEASVQ